MKVGDRVRHNKSGVLAIVDSIGAQWFTLRDTESSVTSDFRDHQLDDWELIPADPPELKPCPVCGAPAVVVRRSVECSGSSCWMPTVDGYTDAEAIACWNFLAREPMPKPEPVPQLCPNCGGTAAVVEGPNAPVYVRCGHQLCSFAGPSRHTRDGAVLVWNRIRLEPE